MKSSNARTALLAGSCFVVFLMAGSGVAMRVGAADGSYRNVIKFSEVLGLVLDNYVDPVAEKDLLLGAYEGLLGSLDARGAYLTPAEVADWKKPKADVSGETGLSVLKAGSIVQIIAVAKGSPAEDAGLKPGDQIRRIDEQPVRPLSWDQIERRLRGAPGSSVRLALVQPREGFRREDREVRRATATAAAYTLSVERGVAVASLRDLGRVKPEVLSSDLRKARAAGASKLLLDLRNSVSASPRDAVQVAGLFTTGNAFVLKDKVGTQIEALAAKGDGAAWPGDIALLVNGGTAGAAEALARLMQARRSAKIYGEGTFGLGADPKLIDLPDGSGLLIPALVWETDTGKRWSEDGVKPDREIKAELRTDSGLEEAEAEQLRRALDDFVEDKPAAEAKPKAA
jgi:carboxyl-terminal processing protease